MLISQNTLADLKGEKENIICTTDDVRGDFLGPPHGTTPAAVIANKMKLRPFKSSEYINEHLSLENILADCQHVMNHCRS